jgi:hypothetical protein
MAEMTRQGWGAGTRVQVRNRFTHAWSSGFVLADEDRDAVHVRRVSDNSVLPVAFEPSEVRPEN